MCIFIQIYLSRSNEQQKLNRSSSFHAYYATQCENGKTEDLDGAGEGEPSTASPGLTVNSDERRPSRVQFKDVVEQDKNEETRQAEGEKTAEKDVEEEFAGILREKKNLQVF